MIMDIKEVTEIAINYAKQAGYSFVKIIKIIPDEVYNKWKVNMDVGSYLLVMKTIEIDDKNGKIIKFE